jgi:hypothetical protein
MSRPRLCNSIVAVLSAPLALSACPAAEGSSGEPASYCAAHTAWEKRCAPESGTPRTEATWGETECPKPVWALVQPRFMEAITACLDGLACGRSDDTCQTEALASLGIRQASDLAGDGLYQQCLERAQQCSGLISDVCVLLPVSTARGRELEAPCLTAACDRVKPCLYDPASGP